MYSSNLLSIFSEERASLFIVLKQYHNIVLYQYNADIKGGQLPVEELFFVPKMV